MADIKLAALPDRKPVKHAILVAPELDAALQDYARLYEATYGRPEPVELLIPAILAAFLESDRGFVRARGKLNTGGK